MRATCPCIARDHNAKCEWLAPCPRHKLEATPTRALAHVPPLPHPLPAVCSNLIVAVIYINFQRSLDGRASEEPDPELMDAVQPVKPGNGSSTEDAFPDDPIKGGSGGGGWPGKPPGTQGGAGGQLPPVEATVVGDGSVLMLKGGGVPRALKGGPVSEGVLDGSHDSSGSSVEGKGDLAAVGLGRMGSSVTEVFAAGLKPLEVGTPTAASAKWVDSSNSRRLRPFGSLATSDGGSVFGVWAGKAPPPAFPQDLDLAGYGVPTTAKAAPSKDSLQYRGSQVRAACITGTNVCVCVLFELVCTAHDVCKCVHAEKSVLQKGAWAHVCLPTVSLRAQMSVSCWPGMLHDLLASYATLLPSFRSCQHPPQVAGSTHCCPLFAPANILHRLPARRAAALLSLLPTSSAGCRLNALLPSFCSCQHPPQAAGTPRCCPPFAPANILRRLPARRAASLS